MSTEDGYRVLERTVEVHAPLEPRQLRSISTLLGRELGYRTGARDYVIDLSELTDSDAVTDYLRRERLPHTVAEERRWDPG